MRQKDSRNFVTLSEIVEKVGKDALNSIMLTRRNDQTLEFDFEKQKNKIKITQFFMFIMLLQGVNSIIEIKYISQVNFL